MGVGRFFCVALPFIMTAGSLILLLAASLSGVANTNLYLFQVNTTDLQINPLDLKSLINVRDAANLPTPASLERRLWLGNGQSTGTAHAVTGSQASAVPAASGKQTATGNLTASDLNLANLYDVSLWGFCATYANNKRNCTKAEFNWAASQLNTTNLTASGALAGEQVQLPKTVTDALTAYIEVAKWTEVVFIIALIALAVELFFGVFATCSRVVSCITYLLAGVASVAVCGAAALATAQAALVAGTVEATAKWYGVESSIDTSFLILVWLSAALACGAGFFWLFTICCCAPDHSSRRRRGGKRNTQDAEKLLPTGAYAPLHDPQHSGYSAGPQYAPGYVNRERTDIAYEPYAHQ